MESTKISSTARRSATCACFAFHRSSPARAASLLGEFATTISGILALGVLVCAVFRVPDLAREGATRDPSPSILRKCGGQGASASPADSSAAASSSSLSSEPGASFIAACGLPYFANRSGTVSTVKSAGSQSGTSCHSSGVETRASATGRTEYAEQVVRSLAFWL